VTPGGALVPSWTGVAASAVLVGLALAVVVSARLGLAREVVVAALRAGVQLVAVGAVLRLLFVHTGLPGSLGWVAGMVVVAGRVAGGRGRGVPRSYAVATAAVAAGVAATLGILIAAGVIATEPRVVVPVGGMVVSTAMQGSAITLARLRDEVTASRRLVEARLALGLPSTEAFAPQLRQALISALTPSLDNTKVVGLIALPGAMTGLILAGVSPLTAIRYQIVVMYMLLGAASLAALVTARLAARALFDPAHRLRELEPAGVRRWWSRPAA
jgi:putative ABC transport system permease protein